MNKTSLIILPFLIFPIAGCGSYWRNRSNDVADIITCNTHLGLGAKARVGPLQAALIGGMDTVGLRGGRAVGSPNGFTYQFVLAGFEMSGRGFTNESGQSEKEPDRNKDYFVTNILVPVPMAKENEIHASYYTQIEVVAAVGGGLRIGFNPGELLDFILGFVGIDIYGDDVCVDSDAKDGKSKPEDTNE